MNVKCQDAVFIAPYTKQNCSKSKLFCSIEEYALLVH